MFRTIKALIFVLSLSLISAFASTISAPEAVHHIGQRATVCGTIAGQVVERHDSFSDCEFDFGLR